MITTLREMDSKKVATLGVILCLPAIIICSGGLLYSGLGLSGLNDLIDNSFLKIAIHPLVILGGMALAAILNLFAVFSLRHDGGALIARLQLKDRTFNLVLLGMVVLLTGFIMLYLIAENLQLFA